ncbi:MAG: nucleotide sugar dehydrogenase [Thermoproteota archaeon]|nr:nucleotide sugar dehydrogenase [Thermoproteota archaeon]
MSESSSFGAAGFPNMYPDERHIEEKIYRGELKVAVCGLGHVGSAMASVWLRAGAHVIGIDKSYKVSSDAREGKTHLPEPGVSDAYREGLRTGRFTVYDDLRQASEDSYLKMICVPVLSKDGSADLSSLKEVASEIGKGLKKGDAVSVSPSVPPGTTEDIICEILEDKSPGLVVDSDFSLIYNPERIYEGRAIEDIENSYPAVIAGAGPNSSRVGNKLYSMIFKRGVVTMSSIKSAETEKLFEGVYRDVNIALANELAKLCEKIGVNFWEVREAANSQPFCNLHKPGVGVGGACIPVYPQFVIDTAKRMGVPCDITSWSRTINNSMPAYCVKEAIQLLDNRSKKSISGSVVTLLGLSFRGGVSDTRLSPTYDVIDEFLNHKVKEIRVHDPLVVDDSRLSTYPAKVSLTTDIEKAVKDTDLVFLVADHPEYSSLDQKTWVGVPMYDGRGILFKKNSHFNSNLRTIGVADESVPSKPIPT